VKVKHNLKTQTVANPYGFPNGDHKQYCKCEFCEWQKHRIEELQQLKQKYEKEIDWLGRSLYEQKIDLIDEVLGDTK